MVIEVGHVGREAACVRHGPGAVGDGQMIQRAGFEIADQPTSKSDLGKVQQAFSTWQQESGLPYTHIGKIAAYSIGTNYESGFIQEQMQRFS